MTLDELFLEWSYRSEKGYPSLGNPSYLSVLKNILKKLEIPSHSILSELDKNPKDTDPPTYSDKDGQPGVTGMESPNTPNDEGCPLASQEEIDNIINKIREKQKAGKISTKRAKYMLDNICNQFSYDPLLDLLRSKGYGQREDKKGNTIEHPVVKKYAREIENITLRAEQKDRDYYIEYLENPDLQIDFEPEKHNNLFTAAKESGISEDIIRGLMDFTTTDEGKKGVGMGEFAMSIIFKNVGDAVGPGDLSLNGETFEIKGQGAVLGKRPDEVNPIDLTGLAKYIIDEPIDEPSSEPEDEMDIDDQEVNENEDDKQLLFRKEKRKTKAGKDKNVNIFYYKGKEVKGSSFAEIMSDIYNTTSDKDGFLKDFQAAFEAVETVQKQKHGDAISEFFYLIDFKTPEGVQNGIALLNFYRYIMKEEFTHFLAHDFGAGKAPGTGQYIYVKGDPIEQTIGLMQQGATFNAVSPNDLKPRIGFGKGYK